MELTPGSDQFQSHVSKNGDLTMTFRTQKMAQHLPTWILKNNPLGQNVQNIMAQISKGVSEIGFSFFGDVRIWAKIVRYPSEADRKEYDPIRSYHILHTKQKKKHALLAFLLYSLLVPPFFQ